MSAFKTLFATAALGAALLIGSAAQATVLVSDDFESYSPTQHGADFYDLNFSAFNALVVEGGTVDLIGTPNAWSLVGATNFVDLDGSTGDGGLLRTNAFSFVTGDVITLQFDVAGNQRGGTDQWDFGFQTTGGAISFLNILRSGPLDVGPGASAFGPAIGAGDNALISTSPWTHYSLSFRAGNSGSFTAYVATTSADNVGPLVDNFLLTRGVPEPATWGLMLVGFGGIGALVRRRRAALALA